MPRKNIDTQRLIYEINRRMITAMIDDAVAESRRRLARLRQPSLESVRRADRAMVAQSERVRARPRASRRTCYANVYRHPRVMRIMADAEAIVSDLFARYLRQPEEMSGALGGGRAGGERRQPRRDRGRLRCRHDRSLRHQGTSPVV